MTVQQTIIHQCNVIVEIDGLLQASKKECGDMLLGFLSLAVYNQNTVSENVYAKIPRKW